MAGGFGRRVARLRTRRAVAAGGLSAVLVASLGISAFGSGFPASKVMLSSGAAWVASAQQGLLTLIDGASDQVVGSVRAPGAGRGDALTVVQSGRDAYVVDRSRGTVSRVDGATYEADAPIRFGAGDNAPDVYPGGGALYVVDGGRRLASVTEPKTLKVRQRLSLAAQPGPGQSLVDGHGRLWIVDGASGGLTTFDGTHKTSRPQVGDRTSQLVLVHGEPVLVDKTHRRLGALDPDGTVRDWSCLEVRPDEPAQLLGSATSDRVFAAVPASGTLVATSLDRQDCSTAVVVGDRGADFGPLAEAAGYVFVPNRTTGHVAVVEAASARVAADLPLVNKGNKLELTAKDGFVFYNDLDGDRAGVIRFDGGQWVAGKALKKYGEGDAGSGLLNAGAGTVPAQRDANQQPGAGQNPAPPGTAQNPTQPPNGGRTGGDPGRPAGPQPPGGRRTPPPDQPPNQPAPQVAPLIRDITWEPATPVRGLPVTFGAAVSNADGASWRWTLSKAGGASVATSTDPGSFTYTLPKGQKDYTIKLEVTGPGGTAEPLSKPVTTTTDLSPQVSPIQTSKPNPVQGDTVTFSATEPITGSKATWTWRINRLDVDSGDPVVNGPVDVPGLTPHRFTFANPGQYRVHLTVDYDGATDSADLDVTVRALLQLKVTVKGTGKGRVDGPGGLSCPGTCTATFPEGAIVTLTPTADTRSSFKGWANCANSGPGSACSITMSGFEQATAIFDLLPDKTPPQLTLSGNGTSTTESSGNRTIQARGSLKQITFTVKARDDESRITRVELWYGGASWSCTDGQIASQATEDIVNEPSVTVNGDTATMPLNLTRGCGSGMHLDVLNTGLRAKAYSEGGESTSGSIFITYRP